MGAAGFECADSHGARIPVVGQCSYAAEVAAKSEAPGLLSGGPGEEDSMEAHSIGVNPSARAATGEVSRPPAKDGGVAAGMVAVIREVEHLLSGAGGLVVVAIGVIAVMAVTSASLGSVAEEERATVATAAFTVLGTIVGAYFGVRVGARGKDEAEAARVVATAKVERLAAHVDTQMADEVIDSVNRGAGPDVPAR
jgi:hypothetical protein